jgi:hypothetical protein
VKFTEISVRGKNMKMGNERREGKKKSKKR